MELFCREGRGAAFLIGVCPTALLLLSACGGGGDGSVDPPVDPLLEAARTARVTGSFNATTLDLTLRWTDRFTSESGFRIERLDGNDWALYTAVPASPGSGSQIEWTVPYSSSLQYRVMAVASGVKYVLKTVSGADTVSAALPNPPPSLSYPTGTLQGLVPLTISNAPAGASVRYSIDDQVLGGTLLDAPFRLEWNTLQYSNGGHVIQAVVQLSQDRIWVTHDKLAVANPSTTPGLDPTISADYNRQTDTTLVRVVAPSDVGIASVQFSVDGQLLPAMKLPNGCVYVVTCDPMSSAPRTSPPWAYDFQMKHADWPNGNHQVRGLVVDNAGRQAELGITVQTNAAPVIAIASPLNNQIIVDPSFRLQAQVSDDLGAADVSVTLNLTEVLRQSAGPIDLTLPLTVGAAASLRIDALDSQGKSSWDSVSMFYQPDSAFRPQAMLESPILFGVDAETALVGSVVDASQQTYLLRRVRGSVDTGLQIVTVDEAARLQSEHFAISGGWVAARIVDSSDGLSRWAIQAWGTDGQRRNLSVETGSGEASGLVYGKEGWFVWLSGKPLDPASERLTLLQLSTGRTLSVVPPVTGQRLYGDDVALASSGNDVKLFFSSPSGVYQFDSSTGQTLGLSPQAVKDITPQTDGQRVVWQRYPVGTLGAPEPYTLVSVSVASPSASTVISTAAREARLADGLLAWREQGLTSNAIKVDDGKSTVVLSSQIDASINAVGGGAVVYGAGGRLYLWTPAKGSRMVLDLRQNMSSVPVTDIRLTRGWLYFKIGTVGTLHRVSF